MIRAILTDIEGTTSALSVLKERLAPYARKHLRAFVREHRDRDDVQRALAEARAEAGEPTADEARTLDLLARWIDEDRKATSLKELQGWVWERGYREGALIAPLYDDVLPALDAWRARGLSLHVYSSGSVLAQALFFAHTVAGDVRDRFDGFFDTRTGAKHAPASYARIAEAIGRAPGEVLFLSDAQRELDAAREAGMHALGVARPGNAPIVGHRVITRFDEVNLDAPGTDARGDVDAHDAAIRAGVVALARFAHARGWALATSGNFSARLGPDRVAITASGRDKGALAAGDVLAVDLDGRPLASDLAPSAETPLHCALYRARADVGAVAHTHSIAATVLSRRALARGVLRLEGYEMQKAIAGVRTHEAVVTLPVVENAQDMRVLGARVDAALARTPDAPGYLVAGHGLTVWGPDLTVLRRHVEAIEFLLACALAEATLPETRT